MCCSSENKKTGKCSETQLLPELYVTISIKQWLKFKLSVVIISSQMTPNLAQYMKLSNVESLAEVYP